MKTDNLLLKVILLLKANLLINVLRLIFSSVLTLVIVIGLGVFFFNEKTIVVPDDFPKIQMAIDEAESGDIILVKAEGGPYDEEVIIETKDIKLIGIGKEKPVLDGMDALSTGITITSTASGVLVKNFIVQKFVNNGLFLNRSNENIIKGNTINDNGTPGGSGIGIILNRSNDNIIKGNITNDNGSPGGPGFGIILNGSNENIIKSNTANDNGSGAIFGFGIALNNTSTNNIIKGNTTNKNLNNGITLSVDSTDNDVFFNRAFDNDNLDIEDDDANNFKANKCRTSSGANVDCGN